MFSSFVLHALLGFAILCFSIAVGLSIWNYLQDDTLKAIYWLAVTVIAWGWVDFQADWASNLDDLRKEERRKLSGAQQTIRTVLSKNLKRFSDSPCTAWARRGTSACTNAGGPMQAYSMDLRERALLDSDAGMKAADVAVKYRVSGSWVRLLKQRRRETGEVAPRVQRHGRRRMLEPHLHTLAALIAEQPDRTLAELKDALGTPASLATIWRAVAALDVTVKKNGPALRTRST